MSDSGFRGNDSGRYDCIPFLQSPGTSAMGAGTIVGRDWIPTFVGMDGRVNESYFIDLPGQGWFDVHFA